MGQTLKAPRCCSLEYDARGRPMNSSDVLFAAMVAAGRRRREELARDAKAGRRSRVSSAGELRAIELSHQAEAFEGRFARPPVDHERRSLLSLAGL